MSALSPTQYELPRKNTRSRGGCNRCRRRRQRCDQQKPCCARCLDAGSPCAYEVRLSWGGRAFRKSVFGKCLGNVERLENTVDGNGFVYCLPQTASLQGISKDESSPTSPAAADHDRDKRDQSPPSLTDSVLSAELIPFAQNTDSSSEPDLEPDTIFITDTNRTPPMYPPIQIPSLPPMARYLLQFYLSKTMRLTVPSSYAQTRICRFLVPISMQQPCLLYAIMAFAAIHLDALNLLPGNAEKLIDTLQWNSMRYLRQLLVERDPIARTVSLATTRTLCQAQIYGGKSLWRVHLNGARAILQSSHYRNGPTESCSCSSLDADFLSSWFNNAEALAALTPSGLLSSHLGNSCYSKPDVFFDMFGGVMSDLPDLFREVGALVKERRCRSTSGPEHSILSDSDIALEADALTREVHFRLQRDSFENLSLRADMLPVFSTNDIRDYALSNAGFLYTALLHIHCGAQALPSSSPEAQVCVEQIIHCAQNMTFSSGLSPRVLLAAPLFTAGLCATGLARSSIKSALTDIGKWMRTPHLLKTLALLDRIWLQFPDGSDSDYVWSWLANTNFDFLPY